MAKLSIEVPERINLRTHNGEAIYVTLEHIRPVAAKALEVGVRTVLTNVWNGGGKDATDAERFAALMKKLDAWKRGEFNVTERGESAYSAYREVWMADMVTAGNTQKASEEYLKAKVAERLGKDTKATFANFIEASAIEVAEAGEMSRDEARLALEAYYAKESERRSAEREEAGSKVKLPVIDLAAFKK